MAVTEESSESTTMHWKSKARIQNLISHLPSSLSYSTYYWLQRHFGSLKRINPVSRLRAGVETWGHIAELGCNPVGKTFLEVGTGRVPLVPIAYWLMGAGRTITIDLNPYLRAELIEESLKYVSDECEEIERIFGSLLDTRRLHDLLDYHKSPAFSLHSFLEFCCINYVAPGDAANTGLADNVVDFHTSYTVLEHVPAEVLKTIIEEGNRILRDDGLFVHRIDYSDHFSHSDKAISAINFLQYSDSEWERYAGNRYMYMNRLRHDDFLNLFESAGHRVLLDLPDMDERALALLRSGTLRLDDRFANKSEHTLATAAAWIVSRPHGEASDSPGNSA
jgi:SAM-dependent methyltransferase